MATGEILDSLDTINDGKVIRYTGVTNAMFELNGEAFPVPASLVAPLSMSNVCFDKINVPFVALGYEISFENR